MDSAFKILYIMGNARSGSTVFGNLVGQHPRIAHFGELKVFAERAWYKPEYCSCGNKGDACEFWSKIKDKLIQTGALTDVGKLVQSQKEFDRLKNFYRCFVILRSGNQSFALYAKAMPLLFSSICQLANVDVVLDSSKSPARANALLKTACRNKLYFIHLVRDPRGVVWSLLKSSPKNLGLGINRDMHPHNPGRSIIVWLATNLLSDYIIRRSCRRYMVVRYEDFVLQPDRVLSNVYHLLGINNTCQALNDSPEPFSASHVIAGNRVRMQPGKIMLRADQEWKEKMPASLNKKVWLYSGWLAKRYGYKK